VTPRGRPPRLSRAAIVAAAQLVVERDGVDALTMRRVADELGASPMALYRHVRGKDELLVALLDELAAAVPRPRLPAAPRERVLAASRHMRDGLAEHPWIVDVLAGGDLIAPSILWLMEEIVAGFIAGGLSPAGAADGYRVIWQFTVGDLVVRRGLAQVAALGRPPFVLGVLESADPERFPALASVAGEWASARGRDTYEPGLRGLVDGLLS
jgi:AcrR family transcriptional regulator